MKNGWIKITKREAKYHPEYDTYGYVGYILFMNLLFGPLINWGEFKSILASIAIALVSWFFLWLMLKKKPIFYWGVIVYMLIWAGFGVIHIVERTMNYVRTDGVYYGIVGFYGVCLPLLFIAYFYLSARTNVTYRLRVRPNDLRKVWGPKRVDRYFSLNKK